MRKFLIHSVLLMGCIACTDQLYQSSIPANDRRTVVLGDTLHFFTVATEDISIRTRPGVYYTWYLRNGFASTQGGYEGMLLDGPYTKMLRDNTLLEKGQFREGLKNGQWVTWHPSGSIEATRRWNQGKRQGSQSSYDTRGMLQQSQSFRKGKQHGEETVYLSYPGSSVKTRHIRTWTDGKLTGPFTIYDSLNQIYQQGGYQNGELDGRVITYERHTNEQSLVKVVEQVYTYRAGQRHGTFVERYADGHIKRVGTYRDGIPYGRVVTYELLPVSDATQKKSYLKQVYSWKDEQYDGPFVEYDAEGTPQRKGNYRAGQLHGKLTIWNSEGEKSVQYYEEGQPVEKQKFSERVNSLKDKLKRKEQNSNPEEVTEQRPNGQ